MVLPSRAQVVLPGGCGLPQTCMFDLPLGAAGRQHEFCANSAIILSHLTANSARPEESQYRSHRIYDIGRACGWIRSARLSFFLQEGVMKAKLLFAVGALVIASLLADPAAADKVKIDFWY